MIISNRSNRAVAPAEESLDDSNRDTSVRMHTRKQPVYRFRPGAGNSNDNANANGAGDNSAGSLEATAGFSDSSGSFNENENDGDGDGDTCSHSDCTIKISTIIKVDVDASDHEHEHEHTRLINLDRKQEINTNTNECEAPMHNSAHTTADADNDADNDTDADADAGAKTTPTIKQRKPWRKRHKFTAFFLLGIGGVLLVSTYQGFELLSTYRKFFGSKAPIPFSPSHGVVAASAIFPSADADADADATNIFDSTGQLNVDYQFKTFRNPKTLAHSEYQQPLRLLVIGDSTARGVGQSNNCYPLMPETLAAVLSKYNGGRPVFWTVLAEPGATLKGIAKQVEKSIEEIHSNGGGGGGGDADFAPTMAEFHGMHRVIDAVAADAVQEQDDEFEYSSDQQQQQQMQWIQKLQYHERLFDANPFAGYDYIIALSGVNDIKRIVVPLMVDDDAPDGNDSGDNKEWGFGSDLKRLIRDLNQNANFHDRVCNADGDGDQSPEECTSSRRLPFIMFPSFPTRHVPAKTGWVLRWVAGVTCGTLDGIKKRVAAERPHHVFAVPNASDEETLGYMNKNGRLWDILDEDEIMLRLVHANEHECKQLIEEMTAFYSKNVAPMEKNMLCNELFAGDAMHPNDDGYDYFGRYLGKEITERWQHL